MAIVGNRVITIRETNEYLKSENQTIKGVVKFTYANNGVLANVTLFKFPPKLFNNSVCVFIDGKNTFKTNVNALNFSKTLPNFENLDAISIVIFTNEKPVALAPKEVENLLSNLCADVFEENDLHVEAYNDDAIAEFNYYETERKLYDQNANLKTNDNLEKEEVSSNKIGNFTTQGFNEIESDNVFSNASKIAELLRKYPKEKRLIEILPESDFVSICYSEGRNYYVGVTTFNNVTYNAVGIKANYGDNHPENSIFIPYTDAFPYGNGYYMIFKPI